MGRRGGMRELTSAILARGVILFIYSALAIFSSPVPLHEQRERERESTHHRISNTPRFYLVHRVDTGSYEGKAWLAPARISRRSPASS